MAAQNSRLRGTLGFRDHGAVLTPRVFKGAGGHTTTVGREEQRQEGEETGAGLWGTD